MKLPAFLYGLTRDVKTRTSRIITQLARGASWDVATQGPVLDTAETEGLIVLDGPARNLGSRPHFHVYLPLRQIEEAMLADRPRLPWSMEDPLFFAALEHAWSTLALQGRTNQSWVSRRQGTYLRPFARATLRFWSEFDDAPRYSYGIERGEWLWACNPMIRYALAHLGVEHEGPVTPIRTEAELRQLLTKYSVVLDPS
jgi:hypothetical protein